MGEWVIGTTIRGTLRDYHRDPFPHSLLRTRESSATWRVLVAFHGFLPLGEFVL